MGAPRIWPLVYSISFQTRPKTSIFLGNNNPVSTNTPVGRVKISEKTSIFSVRNLLTKGYDTEKTYFAAKKYFNTLKVMIIGAVGILLFESFTIFQSRRNGDKLKKDIWCYHKHF